eukprot:CAMPEP_0194488036 /NCGR_PEP_ID=MMETSP0253-20130528/8111_1 /TAXON_ID=2966 /ORGANISM="Noctiluca scintillans" /LENGTH=204 /DNA_ID=CAMNT_0039328351 /DNA_START=444 /DNA_END=1059 /DNA_ORIENTATION=+
MTSRLRQREAKLAKPIVSLFGVDVRAHPGERASPQSCAAQREPRAIALASHAQQLAHKLACFGTQLCMPPHVNSHNALHGLNARLTFEGRLTTKHLEEQHTCGPDVDGVVVRSVLYHLRGEVVHRSDDCLARGFHLRNGRTATEVRKLCHILSARDNLYEHVLRLHVAVHDALCMHVHQALRHIRKCSGCLSVLEAAACLQKLE